MLTAKGKFNVGIEVDGEFHKDFELRETTIRDGCEYIKKMKQNGEDTDDDLVIAVYKAAEQMVSLGPLKPEQITPELLMQLNEEDFIPLIDAQEELVKKRKSLKKPSSPTPK
jgi:hypothetical protein